MTDDPGLLARARGDAGPAEREAAFAELFERHRRPVLSICLDLTASRADAEDALQETFLAVHRALPAFRGDSALLTWICRIAIRVATRLRTRAARLDAPEPLDAEAAVEPSPAPEDGPILAAMQRLTAEQRTVLSLFAIEGLTHAQVATILGVPVGTVWSRLHAARKRLAELLDRA